jgi:hypothetical protein
MEDQVVNRHQRRRQAAMDKHNRFFDQHVRHLPEVGVEALGKPGVRHLVFHHDRQCKIYDGKGCSCSPEIQLFAEPERS